MQINAKIAASLIFLLFACSACQLPSLGGQAKLNYGAGGTLQQKQDDTFSPATADDPAIEPPWWNASWQYRKIVEVNATSVDREDSVFEVWVNFSEVLTAELTLTDKVFDNNSIRVIEHDIDTGELLVHDANYQSYDESAKYEVPSSLWYGVAYSPNTNAYVKVSWTLNGTTAANAVRGYALYFDTQDAPKTRPTYWDSTKSNMTVPEGERYNGASYVTRSLLTLNSSKLAVFLSNNLTSNTQYNGKVLRMWYIGDQTNANMSEYRVNETFLNTIYYQASWYNYITATWSTFATITIPAANIFVQDNKIILKNVQPSAQATYYWLNITYEVFENSDFVKVTFSIYNLHPDVLGKVRIRLYGDLNPSLGTTLITASHRNSEGKTSYYRTGYLTETTTKWDCFWHNNPVYKDFLGFMVPANSWFNFTSAASAYTCQMEIGITGTFGSVTDSPFYQVTAPKGVAPSNIYTPMEQLYADVFTPLSYTVFTAKEKRASITVMVTDQDNFSVENAFVWLNASDDLSDFLAVKKTSGSGQCVFTDTPLGLYNFTVTLVDRDSNETMTTNRTGEYIDMQSVNNYVSLNASLWKMKLDIRDRDTLALPDGGWISVNLTEDGSEYISNVSLSNGVGYFTWKNAFDYNFTVVFNATGYNNAVPLMLNVTTLDPVLDHIFGELTTETIFTDMARVNFTVLDENRLPVFGAVIKVCEQANEYGPLNPATPLVNLTQTGVDGKAAFYWQTRSAGINENYSFYISITNQLDAKLLNATNGNDFDLTYQNFTLTNGYEKEVRVLLNRENYKGTLVAINPPSMAVYWNETVAIQAIYKHNNGGSTYVYETPTSITLTLWDSLGSKLSGPHQMLATSQAGRFESHLSVTSLNLVVGESYTVTIDAAEAGYMPIASLYYYISISAIPTELTTSQTIFDTYWTDTQTFTVQYEASMPQEMDFALQSVTGAGETFAGAVPYIENKWNLTRVDLNFSSIISTGDYTIDVYDPDGAIHNVPLNTNISIIGSWSDGNLSFPVVTTEVTSFSVDATCYYTRIGTVVNYTVTNVGGDATVSLASPGNGWRIKSIVLDFSETTEVDIPAPFNVTVVGSLYNAVHDIAAWRHFQLADVANYYLDPEVGTIDLVFDANSALTFNATISILFEEVTNLHYMNQIDKQQFSITPALSSGIGVMEFPSDKAWETTQLELSFTDVTNSSDLTGLQLIYGGVSYDISDDTLDAFSVTITNPTHDGTLVFAFNNGNILSYNFEVYQANQWINRWGLATSGAVTYYVISNSTLVGTGQPSQILDGEHALAFNPRNTNVGTKNLQVSGALANYATGTLVVVVNVLAVPTRLSYNQTSLGLDFFGEDSIYVTSTRVWTFYLNDTHNIVPLTAAMGTYTWSRSNATTKEILGTGAGTLIDDGTGNYTLDFNTANCLPGRYTFMMKFEKDNYETRSATLIVDVNVRPMRISGANNLGKGSVVIEPQGDLITLQIVVLDESNGSQALTGANVMLVVQSAQYGTRSYQFTQDSGNPGHYSVSIQTSEFDAFLAQVTFSAQIVVEKANYTMSEEFTFTLAVSPPEWFGFPQIYWILVIGSAVLVFAAFGIVKAVKTARIPRIIKDISRTRVEIKKGRQLTEIFIVPSKEEVIYEMVASDWKAAKVPLKPPQKAGGERELPPELEGQGVKEASEKLVQEIEDKTSVSEETIPVTKGETPKPEEKSAVGMEEKAPEAESATQKGEEKPPMAKEEEVPPSEGRAPELLVESTPAKLREKGEQPTEDFKEKPAEEPKDKDPAEDKKDTEGSK